MGQYIIIDTWQDFTTYWETASTKSIAEQIKLWQTSYMNKYPELLNKQVRNYEEDNISWQGIAQKIFPLLPQRFLLMQKARDNILQTCGSIHSKASEKLQLSFNITFVVYVGIGCGAGWATTYNKQPAVLMGLENIAEQKWHTKKKLEGLMAHEIGHLAHMKLRNEWKIFEKAEQDPLFQLYSEGFAQRCEHHILGRESWHMLQDKEWLSWCEQHKSWLAKEFLKRLKKHASVKDFFGSWFSIHGKAQTGYFLGYAFIRKLEEVYDLKEIAQLSNEDVRKLEIQYLKSASKEMTK